MQAALERWALPNDLPFQLGGVVHGKGLVETTWEEAGEGEEEGEEEAGAGAAAPSMPVVAKADASDEMWDLFD